VITSIIIARKEAEVSDELFSLMGHIKPDLRPGSEVLWYNYVDYSEITRTGESDFSILFFITISY
jgi:hypothetical protein